MFNYQRGQKIIEIIKTNPNVRVSELSESLQVSEATIRRDLDRLQKSGKVKRVHGGAILSEKAAPEPPVIQRASEQSAQKNRIGKAAADLIQEGDTVFIGSGTTAAAMAQHLLGRQNITVITNSLSIINSLVQEEGITLITTGGVLRLSELSFIGHITEEALEELRPNKVFMGIRAISLAGGLTNDFMPEVSTDRVIIQSAPEIILLADHTKFNIISTAFVAPLTAVHKIITDTETSPATIAELREKGIDILVV
jgi:DeoR/GlpR family transcriptional regulator of sugar metabolism